MIFTLDFLHSPGRWGFYIEVDQNISFENKEAKKTLCRRCRWMMRSGWFVPEERLVRVLGDWCPAYPGYHLYYPGRSEANSAFGLLVERLRWRGEG